MITTENRKDIVRGSMFGGAVGDALGYPVEFMSLASIHAKYGENGITEYDGSPALISDDTQMALFTANIILFAITRGIERGMGGPPSMYTSYIYDDWLSTQETSFENYRKNHKNIEKRYGHSWLTEVPELFSNRAPGASCLTALAKRRKYPGSDVDYRDRINDSKGCGAVMRIAPLALHCADFNGVRWLCEEAANLSAATHGHSLGYMPSAVLSCILSDLVTRKDKTLKQTVLDAKDCVAKFFEGDRHMPELNDIIDLAVRLSENSETDEENIGRIGGGWVAEETLAIAIYCSLRHHDDFSAGVIAAVNHGGDSDSTGAVTGNILGAIAGYGAIEEKWKKNLELSDIILEIADDLATGCPYGTDEHLETEETLAWRSKYVYSRRVKKNKKARKTSKNKN